MLKKKWFKKVVDKKQKWKKHTVVEIRKKYGPSRPKPRPQTICVKLCIWNSSKKVLEYNKTRLYSKYELTNKNAANLTWKKTVHKELNETLSKKLKIRLT